MALVSLIRLSEPIAFSSLFPYVYFMLISFGIPDSDTFRYSSYYAAAFALFQVLFSIQWGKAADKYGRKPAILVSLFGLSVAMLVFGFAKNYWTGLVARCLMGTFTTIPVVRTLIGELIVKKNQQKYGFSVMSVFWNLGCVIGPAIGGSKYLTNPLKIESQSLHSDFIEKYPFALSNVVIVINFWFTIVFAILFLEETHPEYKYNFDFGLHCGDVLRAKLGFKVPGRLWNLPKDESTPLPKPAETTPLSKPFVTVESSQITETTLLTDSTEPVIYDAVDSDDDASVKSDGYLTRRTSMALIDRSSSRASLLSLKQGVEQGAFTKQVVKTISTNFVVSFHNIVFAEFIPVFLAGDLLVNELKFPLKIRGGFGFDSISIGHLLSSTGTIGVIGIVLLFPLMDRYLRPIVSFRIAVSVFPLLYFLLPFVIFTSPDYNPIFPPGLTKVLLYVLCSFSTVSCTICFPQILAMIHRASLPQHRSYINGAALSITSFARCVAPLCWGWVMTVCEKNGVEGVAWWLLGVLAIIAVVQAFTLKDVDEDEMNA